MNSAMVDYFEQRTELQPRRPCQRNEHNQNK